MKTYTGARSNNDNESGDPTYRVRVEIIARANLDIQAASREEAREKARVAAADNPPALDTVLDVKVLSVVSPGE
jgi:hypothetical protein